MFVESIQPMYYKSYDEFLFGHSLIIEIKFFFLDELFWVLFLKKSF